MSIRAIAQEVYRCQKGVHRLEDQLAQAEQSNEEAIKEQLRIARAELKQLKNMLENKKAQSVTAKKFSPFSSRR